MRRARNSRIHLRLCATLLAILILIPLAASCGKAKDGNGNEGLTVLCTTFPLYDWAKNVVGDAQGVHLELLLSSGTDIHSYQPSVADITKIASADLLIHIGGYSDTWVTDAAKEVEGLRLLTLSEADGITLSMTDGEEHEHSHGEEHPHGGSGNKHEHSHGEFDEHIWLSLDNAIVCSESINKALCDMDTKNAEKYNSNLEEYRDKLLSLRAEYQALAETLNGGDLIFADRFPFVYLFNDLELHCHAAFSGCSTDTEATFDTVIELVEAVNIHRTGYIFVTESSDMRLAKSVIAESHDKNAEILVLDSLQSVSERDIERGYSYLGAMESNLSTLKKLQTASQNG